MIKKEFPCKYHCKHILLISIILLSFTMGFLCLNFPNNYSNTKKSTIKPSQSANYSVECIFPKLFWLEAQIEINIISNESGLINIAIRENHLFPYFNEVNQTEILSRGNQTNTFILKTQPKIQTFPGVYEFIITINGLFDFSQSHSSLLGMGYLLLFILIGFFGIPSAIIIFKKVKISETSYVTPSEPVSYSDAQGLPAGKIKCPKCGRNIPEGLVFCPECGERIPEFMRYNPSS